MFLLTNVVCEQIENAYRTHYEYTDVDNIESKQLEAS